MRKFIFTLLVIGSQACPVIAQNVSLVSLDSKTIEKHADAIAQELWQNTWYKRLTIAAGACAVAYGSYYFFLKKPTTPAVASVVAATNATGAEAVQGQTAFQEVKSEVTLDELKQLIQDQKIDQSKMKVIVEFLDAERRKVDTNFGTLKAWGKTTLNFIIRESAVAVVFSAVIGAFGKYFRSMDSAIDSLLYKVFHPGNLQWYIATHTNIYTLFNDLESHAYCVEHKCLPKKAANNECLLLAADIMLSEDQVAYHKKAFATTWSLCAKELEAILGFMWMKTKQAGQQEYVKRFTQITEHVHELIDNFRSEAEKLLRTDVTMQPELVQAVHRLRCLFIEERSAFTSCEKM